MFKPPVVFCWPFKGSIFVWFLGTRPKRAFYRIEWFANRGFTSSALSGSVITSLREERAGCFLSLLCGFTYSFTSSRHQRMTAICDGGSPRRLFSLVSLVWSLRINRSRICVDICKNEVIVFRISFGNWLKICHWASLVYCLASNISSLGLFLRHQQWLAV